MNFPTLLPTFSDAGDNHNVETKKRQLSTQANNMDYLEKIDETIETLKAADRHDLANRVLSIKNDSYTSTELLSRVVYELKLMTKENVLDNQIISNVNQLEHFCRSIGLYIK